MTHLRIEQNTTGIELVSSAVIKKLYDLVYSGTLDNTSNLLGRLHTTSTYEDYITYLTGLYPNLYITADTLYVMFVDYIVELLCATTWGDGTGCTSSQLSSVSTLGANLFKNNTDVTNLNDLRYFTGLTQISADFAMGATNLTSVTIPANVIYLSRFNGGTPALKGAFNGCTSLTNVQLNEGLLFIDNYAFNGCTGLTTIDIPSTVTELGYSYTLINSTNCHCFSGCTNLQTVTGGEGIETIGVLCFHNCGNLTGILNIDWSNVTRIEQQAFKNCTNFTAVLTLPNISHIGKEAFLSTKITSLDLTNSSVTKILETTFYGCSSLTNVTGLEGITEFGSTCFRNCPASIPIPSTLKTLRAECLRNTGGVYTLLDLQGIEEFDGGTDHGIFGRDSDLRLIFPHNGELYLPNCKLIKGAVFRGSNITGVNLPALETTNGVNCFSGCTSLTTITSLGSITDTGGVNSLVGMFKGCTNLTTATLPNTLLRIGHYTFHSCTNLSTLNFDSTKITTLGADCFNGVNSLTNKVMYFPNVDDIGTNNASTNGYCRMFSNTSNMHIYLPKVTATQKAQGNYNGSTGINSSWLTYRATDSASSQAIINTLYFRDITEFGAGTFYNATITNVIINNTTVPSIVESAVGATYANKSSLDTNVFHGIKSLGSIYVPDAAVNDYKTAPQFASVASYIKPLSECPRITVQQAEQGSSGVIADYLT